MKNKVPSSYIGVRAAQLNRQAAPMIQRAAVLVTIFSVLSAQATACILAPEPTAAEVRRQIARRLASAKYIVLAEVIKPAEMVVNGGDPYITEATWSVRHIWKGSVSPGQTFRTAHAFTDCPFAPTKGMQGIFYLEDLGSWTLTAAGPYDTGELEVRAAVLNKLAIPTRTPPDKVREPMLE